MKDLRIVIGVYTEHHPLKYHLHKIAKTGDNVCRIFLDDCPAVKVAKLGKG